MSTSRPEWSKGGIGICSTGMCCFMLSQAARMQRKKGPKGRKAKTTSLSSHPHTPTHLHTVTHRVLDVLDICMSAYVRTVSHGSSDVDRCVRAPYVIIYRKRSVCQQGKFWHVVNHRPCNIYTRQALYLTPWKVCLPHPPPQKKTPHTSATILQNY